MQKNKLINLNSSNMERNSVEVTTNHKWIWKIKYVYLYTGTMERKADKEGFDMEESKTNTPEIWFSTGRKMTVYAALEDTGCVWQIGS